MKYNKAKLETMEKSELIELLLDQNKRKRNQLGEDEKFEIKARKKRRVQSSDKELDWGKFSKRHIAIKYLYFGDNYHGLAYNDGMFETVERRLLDALKGCKLVREEDTLDTIHYSRCGRTDKGVNAFAQVSAFDVRSQVGECLGNIEVGTFLRDEELNYTKMLNANLPSDIKIVSWAPVDVNWDARHKANYRCYLYFFIKEDRDIDLMRVAANEYLGFHDFTNFSKSDNKNIQKRVERTIDISEIIEIDDGLASDDPNKMLAYRVKSKGFLWHQVRCMMAILFLIGEKLEPPTIIEELFDTKTIDVRPPYNMADDYPLVLYDVGYEDIEFESSAYGFSTMYERILEEWKKQSIQAKMKQWMLSNLYEMPVKTDSTMKTIPSNTLIPFSEIQQQIKRQRRYKPIQRLRNYKKT